MNDSPDTNSARWRRVHPAVWVVIGLVVFMWLTNFSVFGSLPNPFASDKTEDKHPALLISLQDLADFHAATGQFQVIVELDDDARYMPDFLKGEETTLFAVGSVDGVVDLSTLADEALVIEDDRVTVTLPSATLSPPILDLEQTEVIARDRGLFDRIGGVFSDSPTSETEILILAENRLTAAAAESGLLDQAEENTKRTVESLIGQLGFEDITVEFEPDPNRIQG